MLTDQDIANLKHCRKCLKNGVVDIKLIDSLLEKMDPGTVQVPSPRKNKRAENRARFATNLKLKYPIQ